MPHEKLDEKSLKRVNQIIKALKQQNHSPSPEELIEKAFLQGKFSTKSKPGDQKYKPPIIYSRTHETYFEFNDSLEEPISSLFTSKTYRDFSLRLISNFPKIEIGATTKRKREEEPIQLFETETSKTLPKKIKPTNKDRESFYFTDIFRKAREALETRSENTERENNHFTNKLKQERSGDWFSPLDSLKDENRRRFKTPEPSKKTRLSHLEFERSFDPHLLTQLETMRTKLDAVSKEYQQERWIRKLIEDLSKPKSRNNGRYI